MNIVEVIKNDVKNALASIGIEVNLDDVVIEKSKDPTHGDYFFCEEYWINDLTNFITFEV